jgi:GT2 family glycosyltransferase
MSRAQRIMSDATVPVSIVIPTYRREQTLIDTIHSLLALPVSSAEILAVDQTERHEPATERALTDLVSTGRLRVLRLSEPCIPIAMNRGLLEAKHEIVLFLDDDILPEASLVVAHCEAHKRGEYWIVAGRIIQPWHEDGSVPMTGFAGMESGEIDEFMGGNFSVRRGRALALGGLDERFVRVAYNFEAEFAARVRGAGGRIWFEPAASIRHLRVSSGGTRSFGDHLRTVLPSHSVGAYYFLLRARPHGWLGRLLVRPLRSVATRHHLRRPWWIVPSLLAESLGLLWAATLWMRGPKLMSTRT